MEDHPCSRRFSLSAAYDMLPVNVIMPADKEQMALTLNGKKRNIIKKGFFNPCGESGHFGKSRSGFNETDCETQGGFWGSGEDFLRFQGNEGEIACFDTKENGGI